MRRFHLTLVRHGATIANDTGVIQGQMDSPLSELGLKQAEFARMKLKDVHFTHVFSSDLGRAAHTMKIVMDGNIYNEIEFVTDHRLRERCYGVAQGQQRADLIRRSKLLGIHVHDFVPEGAETLAQVRERAVDFFQFLISHVCRHGDDHRHGDGESEANVIIFSHGILLKELMKHFRDNLSCKFNGFTFQKSSVPNASISEFEIRFVGEQAIVDCLSYGNVDHLKGELCLKDGDSFGQ